MSKQETWEHPRFGSLKGRDFRLLADRIEEGHYSMHDALEALRACATRIEELERALRRHRRPKVRRAAKGATMSRRRAEMEIFPVFGEIEAVIAEQMASEGKGRLIPCEQIPDTARFNDAGRTAVFAIMMHREHVPEFNDRIKELRA